MASSIQAAQGQPEPVPPSSPSTKSPIDPPGPPGPPTTGKALRDEFSDFDDPLVYEKVKKHGEDFKAKNFVVKFGAHKALVALNLGLADFQALLNQDDKKEGATPIRWM